MLFSAALLPAQTDACSKLMQVARDMIKNEKFDEALLRIDAAKACATQSQTDQLYKAVMNGLKQQRKKSEAETLLAAQLETSARTTLQNLEQQKLMTLAARDTALALQQTAEAEKFRYDSIARNYQQIIIRTYANSLVDKSQKALRNGKLTEAFNLAEMASLYVDETNPDVIKAFVEAAYYNDHPDTSHRLPYHTTVFRHFDYITSLDFSPDGNMLAIGEDRGDNKVIDWQSGRYLYSCREKNYFSQDGKYLLQASRSYYENDYTYAVLSDITNGEVVKKFKCPGGMISSVAISFDSKWVAIGTYGGNLHLFDVQRESLKKSIKVVDSYSRVSSISFSPDGVHLAFSSIEGSKIWNFKKGKEILSFPENGYYIRRVTFSPDGTKLAIAAENGVITVWDVKRNKLFLEQYEKLYEVHDVAFSANGERLVWTAEDNIVKVWDINQNKEIFALEGHGDIITSVAISRDGNTVASGAKDGMVKIWYLAPSRKQAILIDSRVPHSVVTFSPERHLVATSSRNFGARVYDIRTGELKIKLEEHTDSVMSIVYAPDGRFIATASKDSSIKIWDLQSGKSLHTLREHTAPVTSVAYHPQGKVLATGSIDNTVILWDVNDGTILRTLKGHTAGVNYIAFSPDGKTLATASQDGYIYLWDHELGRIRLTLPQGNPVRMLAFSPDSRSIAVSTGENDIRCWDIHTGKTVFAIKCPDAFLLSLAFSPNGNWLATGGNDHAIRLWDWRNGREIFKIIGHAGNVISLAFSHDGKRLGSGSEDKTVKLWDLTAESFWDTWEAKRKGIFSYLACTQLEKYNLDKLLDIRPENVQLLMQSKKPWETAEFADYYAKKVKKTEVPNQSDFNRAIQLYRYCNDVIYNNWEWGFKGKISELEEYWKEQTK